jgi:transposase
MVAEIISTVERRRHWPDDEKLRILSEALLPGATVAAVADRNGVCRSLLYTWLRLAREGKIPGISMTRPPVSGFVPVRIESSTGKPSPSSVASTHVGTHAGPWSSTGTSRDLAHQWPRHQSG